MMGLSKKSESYILGGSTLVLTQFNKMRDLVPIPYVGTALEVVQVIVDIVKTIRDNKEKCCVLLEDLGCLMVVVMRPLVGLQDVPVELRENLSDLTTRLLGIKETLELFRQARWYDQVIRSQDRKDALTESNEKLKTALAVFNVAQQIDAALSADALKTQVEDVKVGVSSANGKLDIVISTLATATTPGTQRELPSTVLPPKPQILFGRDEEIEIVWGASVPLMTAGGIGKTTIVCAIAYHERIVEKFQDRVKWVPCAEATTPELLLELAARSVGVTTNTPGQDRKEKILKVLRSSASRDKPHLIICDNFETPWDAPGGQGAVADILQTITSVAGVSLLLTMRGHTPPAAGRIAWSEPQLQPLSTLSLYSSRELYLGIHENASEDSHLDDLLLKLSYMPLAVRLAATYGRDGGVMPAALVKRWDSRTIIKALDHGDERTESVVFSVELSIQSNTMKRTPEALTLLSILAQLPGGARRAFIPQFAPFDEHLVDDAIAVLSKVSLIQIQATTGLITMLSPVHTVVLEAHPIDEQHRAKLLSAYFDFIASHSSVLEDLDHIPKGLLLRTEHVNCETLLRSALETSPSEDCLKAIQRFSAYLLWTFPDSTLLALAVDKIRTLQTDRKHQILATCLYKLGIIQVACGMPRQSEATLGEAFILFKQMGRVSAAATALESLTSSYRLLNRHDEAARVGEDARMLFKAIGDVRYEADALLGLGKTYISLRRYGDAVSAGEQARVLSKQIGSKLGESSALQSLSLAYRGLGRYDDAVSAAEQANALSDQIGDGVGKASIMRDLGEAYLLLGRYENAIQTLRQARSLFTMFGSRIEVGHTSWNLSRTLKKQGKLDEALASAREALSMFPRIGRDREIGILTARIAALEAMIALNAVEADPSGATGAGEQHGQGV